MAPLTPLVSATIVKTVKIKNFYPDIQKSINFYFYHGLSSNNDKKYTFYEALFVLFTL
ncbi:hypothetical protein CMALT430_240122 [Carnobacterium maltaromaticum]|nr:hypothetical protein CMALT430_240122 [Carnobacterium maltaromaticum]